MARLVIALLILAAVALALAVIAAALRPVYDATSRGVDAARREVEMPDSFQKVAYVLLIVLMIGVASGLVGGL